jgi:hypothetical protein
MFQYHRTVIGFIFVIVAFQSIYYICTIQMKKQDEHFQTVSNSTVQFIMTFQQKTTTLKPFVNTSFSGPDPDKYSSLLQCDTPTIDKNSNASLKYRVDVSRTLYSHDELEKKHGIDMDVGGHWHPLNCQANQCLAVVICYRQREQHLQIFLNNIHPFLKAQQLDYTIIVVNQHGKEPFNRGALFNVGYAEAMKLYPFNCFIFHDVDLLPEDSRNIYKCGSLPRHMYVAIRRH